MLGSKPHFKGGLLPLILKWIHLIFITLIVAVMTQGVSNDIYCLLLRWAVSEISTEIHLLHGWCLAWIPDSVQMNPVVDGVFHHLRLAGGGRGEGVKRPQRITPEQTATTRRARRETKALDEAHLMGSLNLRFKITGQVRVGSKVKI